MRCRSRARYRAPPPAEKFNFTVFIARQPVLLVMSFAATFVFLNIASRRVSNVLTESRKTRELACLY